MTKQAKFSRDLNGIIVEQRKDNGFINATSLSKAHFTTTGQRREVSEWLSLKRTQESLEHLSGKTEIPVSLLIQVRRGGTNQGTWIHPRLATRFAIWVSDELGYTVEGWIEEWMTTGRNPIKNQSDLDWKAARWTLKDEARVRACGQLKEYLSRIGTYYKNDEATCKEFAKFHDRINITLTTETAQQMRGRLSLLLGRQVTDKELIRDYFPIVDLQRFTSLCEAIANLMLRGMPPRQAILEAYDIVLPINYKPKPIDFESQLQLVKLWGNAA